MAKAWLTLLILLLIPWSQSPSVEILLPRFFHTPLLSPVGCDWIVGGGVLVLSLMVLAVLVSFSSFCCVSWCLLTESLRHLSHLRLRLCSAVFLSFLMSDMASESIAKEKSVGNSHFFGSFSVISVLQLPGISSLSHTSLVMRWKVYDVCFSAIFSTFACMPSSPQALPFFTLWLASLVSCNVLVSILMCRSSSASAVSASACGSCQCKVC